MHKGIHKATPITLNTLGNDGSPNNGTNGNLNPSSVTVTTSPSNGITSVDPTTGNITYTPVKVSTSNYYDDPDYSD